MSYDAFQGDYMLNLHHFVLAEPGNGGTTNKSGVNKFLSPDDPVG